MKLQHEAREKCEEKSKAFGRCVNSLSVGGCTVLYCTVPTTVVNGCLNSHYNEDVFKKYVAELGYDYEGKPANNGLFR